MFILDVDIPGAAWHLAQEDEWGTVYANIVSNFNIFSYNCSTKQQRFCTSILKIQIKIFLIGNLDYR